MSAQQTQFNDVINLRTPWFRAKDGLIAGVCAGIARKFDIDPWLVRLGLLLTILTFGVGLLLYVVLAFCLPKEDQIYLSQSPKLLGVCTRVSQAISVDVSLLRAAAVLLAFSSAGTALFGYVILHFLVPEPELPRRF